MGLFKIIGLIFVSTLLQACAHVPKETLELSGEMTVMISSAKDSHKQLINQFAEEERKTIDLYVQAIFIPEFISRALEQSKTESEYHGKDFLEDTCNSKGERDRSYKLQKIVEGLSVEITAKRKELTDILDKELMNLNMALDRHYDLLEASNRAITDNLRSVDTDRQVNKKAMEMLKLDPTEIKPLKEISDKMKKIMWEDK